MGVALQYPQMQTIWEQISRTQAGPYVGKA